MAIAQAQLMPVGQVRAVMGSGYGRTRASCHAHPSQCSAPSPPAAFFPLSPLQTAFFMWMMVPNQLNLFAIMFMASMGTAPFRNLMGLGQGACGVGGVCGVGGRGDLPLRSPPVRAPGCVALTLAPA